MDEDATAAAWHQAEQEARERIERQARETAALARCKKGHEYLRQLIDELRRKPSLNRSTNDEFDCTK